MESEEDRQAEAIAASWGIDASLLEGVEWSVDTIDGNDGELYGYLVRFDDSSEPDVLSALGLDSGEFTRQLSINAFDEPDYNDDDYDRDLRIKQGVDDGASFAGKASTVTDRDAEADDGLSSINAPLPDISDVVDDNFKLPGAKEPDEGPASSADGVAATNFANSNFNNFTFANADSPSSSGSFVTEQGDLVTDEKGNRIVFDVQLDPLEALRRNVLARMDDLERVFQQSITIALNRGHNHPPELLEIERTDGHGLSQEVTTAIAVVRREGASQSPNITVIATQETLFRRLAGYLKVGALWLTASAVAGIVGQEASTAYMANKQHIYETLINAADSVASWLQYLQSSL